jgi:hypothetical protein
MEQRQTPESLTVKSIIELTLGEYGSKKFGEFFAAQPAQKHGD